MRVAQSRCTSGLGYYHPSLRDSPLPRAWPYSGAPSGLARNVGNDKGFQRRAHVGRYRRRVRVRPSAGILATVSRDAEGQELARHELQTAGASAPVMHRVAPGSSPTDSKSPASLPCNPDSYRRISVLPPPFSRAISMLRSFVFQEPAVKSGTLMELELFLTDQSVNGRMELHAAAS